MWSNILVVKHVAFALNKESKERQPYFAHCFTWRKKFKLAKILGNVYQV